MSCHTIVSIFNWIVLIIHNPWTPHSGSDQRCPRPYIPWYFLPDNCPSTSLRADSGHPRLSASETVQLISVDENDLSKRVDNRTSIYCRHKMAPRNVRRQGMFLTSCLVFLFLKSVSEVHIDKNEVKWQQPVWPDVNRCSQKSRPNAFKSAKIFT